MHIHHNRSDLAGGGTVWGSVAQDMAVGQGSLSFRLLPLNIVYIAYEYVFVNQVVEKLL